jgi:hypothetical protein
MSRNAECTFTFASNRRRRSTYMKSGANRVYTSAGLKGLQGEAMSPRKRPGGG